MSEESILALFSRSRYLFGILAVLGLGLWIFSMHPHLVDASVPSVSLVSLEPGKVASATNVLPTVQETGVLIYDLSHGGSGTPYLVYLTPRGELMTKQLVFSVDGACDPAAGDMPCTDTGSEYPDIPAGTALSVTGGEDAQGLFADSYQTATTPNGMVVFADMLDQSVTLSNGSSIVLKGVADDANCTLFMGCFGDGVARAYVQISNGNSSRTVEMVPGSLHEIGNATYIVLSVSGSGSDTQIHMLAIAAK